MNFCHRSRWLTGLAVGLMTLTLAADVAEARAGRGGGFGLRGSRSFQAPPPTRTAPVQSAPLQREQQPGVSMGQQSASRAAASNLGRRAPFGAGGFMGGLFGAGLLGMFLGYGFLGGMGGLGSIMGLLFQMALVAGVIVLALRFFRGRAPVPAGAGMPGRGYDPASVPPLRRNATGSGGSARTRRSGSDEVGIVQADLDSFERLLGQLQTSYGRGDRSALRALAVPQVAAHLEGELDEDAARNVVNRVSDVKLLQGDLAEAWREGSTDYATVAMRYALQDHVEDLTTGQILEGSPDRPSETVELWTFARERQGSWLVSAIQPA